MAIKIDNIKIKKLGPLSSLELELGTLNLIYGRNESGKTYLTEFILQSIFRHAKTWKLRDIDPEGSIHLQGLQDQATVFSPSSSKKIEDYWSESERGLPLNMARLLVVKGGELALSSASPGGVDRDILKNALTSQVLLDQIRGSIQTTVQKAQIIDQKPRGNNQGQISDWNDLEEELQDVENLLKLIEEKYSRGPVRQIEIQIEALDLQLTQQLKAQKHQAYLLSKKQGDLRLERNKISDDSYLSLRDRVRDHKKLKANLKKLNEKLKSSQADVENYHWLESALDIWEINELEKKRLPEIILLVAGGALLTIGLIATALQNILSWPYLYLAGIITAGVGGITLVYFGIQLFKGTQYASDAGERETIRGSFQDKFGQSLRGITGLRAEQNKLRENFLRAKSMQEELGKLEFQIETDQQWIEESFQDITGESIPEKSWKKNLEAYKDKTAALDAEISNLGLKLAKFDIEENEYLSTPQDIEFSSQNLKDIKTQVSNLEVVIRSHQTDLDTLKAGAVVWTRDEISTPWRKVLHHLRIKRDELCQSHIDLTAEIVAKIGLSEILRKIEEEEDQKILENLNTDEVSSLLNKLTGKYQSLNLIDDQIYVRDPYQEYPLRDLSTGAREQIQLALRLGIASHVSGGEPLFIILDDAFQHSDWNRRTSLVQETVDLASQGWQVIYLSMDDHIRDLFQKIAKPVLKKKFKYFELD
ncbi:MAG: hypothetical protein J7L35_09900 [Anaerolineales bacterium]|nr:hypothetical protein [Anaerolineales bacterium]